MNYTILELEQGTPEWLQSRAGVITGTKLGRVMGSAKVRQTLIYELIAEQIAPLKENIQTATMERGHLLEEIVKEEYPEVQSVGFIKKNDYIGLSPDGVIFDGETIRKAVEIKSPEAKKFIEYAIEGGIPDDYYWQVVHYFVVIDTLEELDFIIFNPEIKDEKFRKRVIKVTRKQIEKDIMRVRMEIESFRFTWIDNLKMIVQQIS